MMDSILLEHAATEQILVNTRYFQQNDLIVMLFHCTDNNRRYRLYFASTFEQENLKCHPPFIPTQLLAANAQILF